MRIKGKPRYARILVPGLDVEKSHQERRLSKKRSRAPASAKGGDESSQSARKLSKRKKTDSRGSVRKGTTEITHLEVAKRQMGGKRPVPEIKKRTVAEEPPSSAGPLQDKRKRKPKPVFPRVDEGGEAARHPKNSSVTKEAGPMEGTPYTGVGEGLAPIVAGTLAAGEEGEHVGRTVLCSKAPPPRRRNINMNIDQMADGSETIAGPTKETEWISKGRVSHSPDWQGKQPEAMGGVCPQVYTINESAEDEEAEGEKCKNKMVKSKSDSNNPYRVFLPSKA